MGDGKVVGIFTVWLGGAGSGRSAIYKSREPVAMFGLFYL